MIRYPDTSTGGADEHEWAIILSGGDGTRLKCLTRRIAGDERPKQFCPVLGTRTLLEETQTRVALELSPERTLYVLNRCHEKFYTPLLSRQSAINLVVQPGNRGTAPAILFSLQRIAARDANAVVVFLPSDHYISDDVKFMEHIRFALNSARKQSDRVILLGLDPETPEVEYGWIEPAAPVVGNTRMSLVRRFWEKPNQLLAQVLQLRGCLWNSFVMVACVRTLLELIEEALPQLYQSFAVLKPIYGTHCESWAVDDLYRTLPETNFSQQVLTFRPERLAVLKVTGVRWNDLGEPKRVLASLDMAGLRPHWANLGSAQFA